MSFLLENPTRLYVGIFQNLRMLNLLKTKQNKKNKEPPQASLSQTFRSWSS